jgi:hypothetical protein
MAVDIQKTFDWKAVRFAELNQGAWDSFYGSSECPRFGFVENGRFSPQFLATKVESGVAEGGS